MTAGFRVRVADPGDSAGVSALLAASYRKLWARRYEAQLLARALPLMIKANPRLLASRTFYVAQIEGGKLVGCGGWSIARPGTGETKHGEAHIRHFATHPTWTRRGVGRALLSRCLQDAKAKGVRSFECYSSLVSVEFYLASGFVEMGPIDLEVASDLSIPVVLMRREL